MQTMVWDSPWYILPLTVFCSFNYVSSNFYLCPQKERIFVHKQSICDGVNDCDNAADEAFFFCLYKFWIFGSSLKHVMEDTMIIANDLKFKKDEASMKSCLACLLHEKESSKMSTPLNELKSSLIHQDCQCTNDLFRCFYIQKRIEHTSSCKFIYVIIDSANLKGNLSRYLTLSNTTRYRYLSLQNNFVSNLDKVFNHICAHILHLDINKLIVFGHNYFKDSEINYLWMSFNHITLIESFSINGIRDIKLISLAHNEISILQPSAFQSNTLNILILSYNLLQALRTKEFGSLPKLNHLDVFQNKIRLIENDFFTNLTSLTDLDLSYNLLSSLPQKMSEHLTRLRILNLQGNKLLTLIQSSYFPQNLRYLCLMGINIQNIHFDVFYNINLTTAIFNDPDDCLFVSRYQNCLGIYDGSYIKLPSRQLVEAIYLRHLITIYVLLVLGANIMLLVSINHFKKGSGNQRILISNLCIANILMDIFLVTLNAKNAHYSKNFTSEAVTWMHSPLCQIIGIAANISCEASLSFICFVSLQRVLLLMFPYSYSPSSISKQFTITCVLLIWIFCFLLSFAPVLFWKNLYYGSSIICYPLFLHTPRTLGWQYSFFLFIINCIMTSAVILSTCKIIMIYISRKERTVTHHVSFWSRSISSGESHRKTTFMSLIYDEFTVKLVIIVIVKLTWWTPLFCLKLFSLTGGILNIQLDSIMVLFLIPIPNFTIPMSFMISVDRIRKCLRPFQRAFTVSFSRTLSTDASFRMRSYAFTEGNEHYLNQLKNLVSVKPPSWSSNTASMYLESDEELRLRKNNSELVTNKDENDQQETETFGKTTEGLTNEDTSNNSNHHLKVI